MIRTPEMSLLASSLSQKPEVRDYSTQIQRELGKDGGIVVEGRDAGSVVFPQAELKFFLDADLAERARRRHLELTAKHAGVAEDQVRMEIEKRDRDDSERALSPLVQPEGSIYVDTGDKSLDEVVKTLEEEIRKKE
jgi:CMP/dCMP kinase